MTGSAPLAADYQELGYAIVQHVLNDTAVAALTDALERDRRRPSVHHGRINPADELGVVDSDLFASHRDPAVANVCRSGPIPSLAAVVLGGTSVVLIEDQWFRAEPQAMSGSPWHHDAPYYNIDGAFCVVWLALDDHPSGTGLSVVPGSHRTGRTFPPRHFGADDAAGARGGPAEHDLAGAVDLATAAGDVVVFHARTLHRGGPPGDALRRRWSIRYAAPSATYADRGRDAAAFWRLLDHGLQPGDPLASSTFPIVHADTEMR